MSSKSDDGFVYPFKSQQPDDNGAPPLDDVTDGGRVALFDPDRCDKKECWLQIDESWAVDIRRCR